MVWERGGGRKVDGKAGGRQAGEQEADVAKDE